MFNLILLIVLFLLSTFFNKDVFLLFNIIRSDFIDTLAIWFTTTGMLIITAALVLYLFKHKKTKLIFLLTLSALSAIELSFILKFILKIPRPYDPSMADPLILSHGFSFPSIHSAFVFAVYAILSHEKSRLRWPWLIFALLIGFSRIYLGVHTFNDVVGGFTLGYLTGYTLYFLNSRYNFVEKFYHQAKDRFELRRQLIHAFIGIAIIILRLIGLLPMPVLTAILILGAITSFVSRKHDLPLIKNFLDYFERPHKRRTFPGQGAFFLVLGSWLSLMFYEENIALAGIAVMAIGDCVTNIFGSYFGKIKNPLNKKKNIEGTAIAIIFSTLSAWYFLPINYAFIGSLIAMVIESVDIKIGKFELDDNILIPILFAESVRLIG